ncbi:MAG TPA: hypothetical protein VH298_08705 [Jatrophihabitans sp.]|nr:hypothetical protein [Jatrophihabitans sp.]
MLLAGGAAVLLQVAGCGNGHGSGRAHQLVAVADSPSPVTAQPGTATKSTTALPDPAAAAVATARAFTAEICPYSYTESVSYGQRFNTALARWGTARFAAAHKWPAARIATAAAGLAGHQAEQVCGQVTGGIDPEASGSGGSVLVRLSVSVTAHSSTGPASSAQQVFTFELVHPGARWLIEDGHW